MEDRALFGRKAINIIGLTTALAVTLCLPPASQAASQADITKAIQEAKIFPSGTQLKIRVTSDRVLVSTFRDSRANEKDLKIEAVLIGKAVFDLPDSNFSGVSVFFYDTANPRAHKSINITKGDVAAFGSGQVSQDELLNSLSMRVGDVSDPRTAIENQLMLNAASKRQAVDLSFQGDEVIVSTKMPGNAPVRELKYEALRIADTAIAKLSGDPNIKKVKVNFFSTSNPGQYQELIVPRAQIEAFNNSVLAALASMPIVKRQAKVTAESLEVADGVLKKQRSELLASIQELEKMGVGVAPFIAAFTRLETQVGEGDEATLKKSIDSLSENIKKQKESYESAKNAKPVKDGEEESDEGPRTAHTGPMKTPKSKGRMSRWAFGFFPLPVSNILADPSGYMKDRKKEFEGKKGQVADNTEEYYFANLWFSAVLKENNRADEAGKFDREAARVYQLLQQKKR